MAEKQGTPAKHKGGRKPTGSVVDRKRKGHVVYAIRFRAYGQREYETLGSSANGWTRALAEEELERRLAEVKLGQYIPPDRDPIADEEPAGEPTFREFAWRWFEQAEPELK